VTDGSATTDADDVTFRGKTALIFGGGRNIGRAIAQELARRGARLAIGDIDEEAAREAADLVTGMGGTAVGLYANVMDRASMAVAVASAEHALGEIDIVLNNAGLLHSGNPEDFPLAEWQRMFDCNFFGIVRSNEIFLPKMLARGSGHIVNTASFAGLYPYASSRAPYAASKAAIVSLSQNLALYLEPRGIRVTCLCPGPTASQVSLGSNTFSESVINRGPGSELGVMSMDEVANILADGMRDGRIVIPTHEEGYATIRAWAASPDDFIRQKAAGFERGETGLPTRRPVGVGQ
jgi:NAD(P)-dependent dehydrogenase (short-subunit alcohol dehydrogenase family)